MGVGLLALSGMIILITKIVSIHGSSRAVILSKLTLGATAAWV
jgi:hypothetical protein